MATSFQGLFNDFGGELVGAVGCCVIEDGFKGTETVFWMAVLDNVLDDPISPLTTSNGVDIFENLLNTRSLPVSLWGEGDRDLVFIQAILKDVLNDQTSSLAQRNLSPNSPKRIIDILHNHRRIPPPPNLQNLLPNMTRKPMTHRLRNPTK
jgi:hypothetical protein